MTELIACLTTGKGTWGYTAKLIGSHSWDNIFLVTNEFGNERFSCDKEVHKIVVDTGKPLKELAEEIRKKLYGKIRGTEVALNIISGTGKEHMALISAILKLGLALRLVEIDNGEITEV